MMECTRSGNICRALVVLTSAFLTPIAALAAQYRLVDLGTLGGPSSVAYAINDSGQIVGAASYPSAPPDTPNHAFIYQNGKMSALGDPFSSGGSVATAINANGSTVGYALPVNSGFPSYSGPVVWENGLVATVGTTPSTGVFTGINASGQASGYSNIHALRFGNGTLTDLGTLGATYGRSGATGINDNGQLCGYASLSGTNSANTVHAFLYGTGAMTDLGSLGGNSYASAINASGQVAGVSYLSNNLTLHAVLYDHGSILDLPTLGTNSYAFAINNRADIVGYYYESGNSSTFRAFLFSGGVMQDLNSTIDPGSGFTLQSAEGINNVGQIVGYGTNVYGQTHGFLLTPVPEPSALVWIGVVGMIVHRRLRVSLQKSCRVLHRRPILIA